MWEGAKMFCAHPAYGVEKNNQVTHPTQVHGWNV